MTHVGPQVTHVGPHMTHLGRHVGRHMTHVGCWGPWIASTLVYCVSFVSHTPSGSVHLHQSVMLSEHLLGGLPRGRSLSTIPNITVFISRWSYSLQMCLNSFNFFSLIRSIMVHCLSTFSLTLWLACWSFQHTLLLVAVCALSTPRQYWCPSINSQRPRVSFWLRLGHGIVCHHRPGPPPRYWHFGGRPSLIFSVSHLSDRNLALSPLIDS